MLLTLATCHITILNSPGVSWLSICQTKRRIPKDWWQKIIVCQVGTLLKVVAIRPKSTQLVIHEASCGMHLGQALCSPSPTSKKVFCAGECTRDSCHAYCQRCTNMYQHISHHIVSKLSKGFRCYPWRTCINGKTVNKHNEQQLIGILRIFITAAYIYTYNLIYNICPYV